MYCLFKFWKHPGHFKSSSITVVVAQCEKSENDHRQAIVETMHQSIPKITAYKSYFEITDFDKKSSCCLRRLSLVVRSLEICTWMSTCHKNIGNNSRLGFVTRPFLLEWNTFPRAIMCLLRSLFAIMPPKKQVVKKIRQTQTLTVVEYNTRLSSNCNILCWLHVTKSQHLKRN